MSTVPFAFLGFGGIGAPELMIVGIIALLLFGKRLPEVARSLGKGITEFKKGVQGIDDEVHQASYSQSHSRESSRPAPADDRAELTAPKFEPPASAPVDAIENRNS